MAKFKTRARTLDMLGRQQIAGIPTAVSELFKNAHDAYADRVEIDYYRSDGLFVLRDDGLGMTKEDFLNRWLSIGTESKIKSSSMQPTPKDPTKKERPMLGEKGIGRLAIAKIGPQVLILSRARRGETLSQLIAAFINWSIFECPGINLEDIEMPVRSFRGGKLPAQEDVLDMIAEFKENIGKFTLEIGKESVRRIRDELEAFDVDPVDIDSYLGSPTLTGKGSGTHFIIKPSSELLPLDIDGSDDADMATPLKKALLGFTNTMVPRDNEQVIKVAFRDHKTDEINEDHLDEEEFFTPEEFNHADHQVEGEFDIFGQFKGNIRIYGDEVPDHVIPWGGNSGNQTECGAFKIKFAAFEGENRHSTLPSTEHAIISKKAGEIGGLYIYKDGIRILPYGDTDYDWLDIEYRRTKSANYYYFSHRKMFGAIEIDAKNNYRLQEKAGREGFQENKAYRQFKSILRNFLQQMAADFFRKEGAYSERFEQKKQELGKQEQARRRRESLASEKRRALSNNMDEISLKISNQIPQNEVLELSEDVASKLESIRNISDPNQAASMIIEIEATARTQLKEIESKYKLQRPKAGLSKSMYRNWQDYVIAYNNLVDDVFRPAYELIEDIVAESSSKVNVEIDRRSRVQTSLDDLIEKTRKEIRSLGMDANRSMDTLSNQVRDITRGSMQNVENGLRSVMVEFQHADLSKYDGKKLSVFWEEIEGKIIEIAEHESDKINAINSLFELVDFDNGVSVVDQLVAIEQRNIWLEEEVENDLQLVQLGMAIEVINHEFNATIRSIRNNIRRLKAWADINDELAPLYERIRANFEHLDGYLTLFTPLHRRLYRKEVLIRGSDIYEFLQDLFQERLTRHHVDLVQTKAFSSSTISGYPSSFYPVFVNLIDNAIFWLSGQNPSRERRIELDEENSSWVISDTGPGISQADRESIFEFGFTRKPGGRGMGLHISREALRRVGYALELSPSTGSKGASFTISAISKAL